jgi:hypothetical protein
MFKYLSVAALALTMFLFAQAAFAEEPWPVQYIREKLPKTEEALNSSRQVLESKAQTEWTSEEITEYLRNANFSIYYALEIYILLNREQPVDSASLRSAGIIATWPGNPYRNWEPMDWYSNGEFRPGDLVLQLCPPTEYSYGKTPGVEVPLSCILSINGPSQDFEPVMTLAKPFDFSWGQVPAGSAWVLGCSFTSAKAARERKAKRDKASTK